MGSGSSKCPENTDEGRKLLNETIEKQNKKLEEATNNILTKNARILNDALRLKGQAPIYQNEYNTTPPTNNLTTLSDTLVGARFGGSRRTRRSCRKGCKSRKNRSRK